jgi:hypothetical protein
MGERVVADPLEGTDALVIDRRRAARRAPDAGDVLARVRLRGGRELGVLNISPGGALLEGETRLLPGTHVDVHVTTRDGRVLVRARVMRAWVVRLRADAVSYRVALTFETPVDTATHGYPVPGADPALAPQRTGYPDSTSG